MLPFVLYTRRDYRANWHHKLLCEKLDHFVAGRIPRLMVFMPPRHGKSELASRCLPAFILGKNPDASIIATSYSADLAAMMNRDVQRIIDSEEYRRLFPDTRLNESNARAVSGAWMRNSDLFEVVGRRGVYRSAGVGGGITGMGANYSIIDDPVKNMEEAYSSAYRDKVWNWYSSTLYTRLQGKVSGVLIVLTRWHEDDLAGRLLEQAKQSPDADQWDVISCEAIKRAPQPDEKPRDYDPREEGEALWPDSEFDIKKLKSIKATVMPLVYSALYDQNPTPAGGNILMKQWWHFWYPADEPPPEPWRTTLEDGKVHEHPQRPLPLKLTLGQSWDLAFKDTLSSAYVVGQEWGFAGAHDYLLAQSREKRTFLATLKAIRDMRKDYPRTQKTLIEEKANGSAVMNVLCDEIAGIVAIDPEGSKEARAHAASTYVFAGNVWLPHPRRFPWVQEFIEEAAKFPGSKYKDQVDTATQWINHRHQGGASIMEGMSKL